LPAWLHKAALLESKSWLRGELGRRRREEAAAELGTTMKSADDEAAFHALVPLLDEALLSLREKDRVALLLRFYENQSMRDVGSAFGITEDTARKRVETALEKVTAYFKRRGYRTATVAATIAALKHTAVSTSATVLSAVVMTVTKSAPPALAGLSALLARLASVTKVQTAAVCVALAAVPVGWKLNEGRVAARELTRVEAQLIAGTNDAANLQSELERLRANVATLDRSLAQANAAEARAAADAQAFADWKQSTRARLLAADYRWDDNSAFVRIPKAVLPELLKDSYAEPYAAPGMVKPFARELLGMTPDEQQAVEAAMQRRFAEVDGKLAPGITETNLPAEGMFARKSFGVSVPADSEFKSFGEQIIAEMGRAVGEERRRLIEARPPQAVQVDRASLSVYVRTNDAGHFMAGGSISFNFRAVRKPTFGIIGVMGNVYSLNTLAGVAEVKLSMFLPDGDPNQTPGIERFMEDRDFVPHATKQRATIWLQEQAVALFNRKKNP